MYKIGLINMPFAVTSLPSVALLQLKSAVSDECTGKAMADIHYLNYDVSIQLGQIYTDISCSLEANMCGAGDWFFKKEAFPHAQDDPERYLRRFFPQLDGQMIQRKQLLLKLRKEAGALLEKLIDQYHLDSYDMVGFTSMFCQNVASFALAKRLKQRKPEMVIVMGGANCESPMGEQIIKNVPEVDFVFSGPALKSFPEFLKHKLANDEEKCHAVKGVFSRQNVSREIPQAQTVGEEIEVGKYASFDYSEFLDLTERTPGAKLKPTIMFETSRGCWWGQRAHCTFCGLNGTIMAYKAMPVAKALEQFHHLFQYAGRCKNFQATDNIMPKEYIAQVFGQLTPPEDINIFYEVKADLTKEDMAILAKARVTEIQPGIESLATSTLKLMKKGTTAFQNIRFLKNCLTHRISPAWNLLIGFPGETAEVYRKYVNDLPLLAHVPPPSGVFPVRFDRYSPYFMKAKDYGLELRPHDFYSFIYPFSSESLGQMAYYFTDTNYSAQYLKDVAQWLGPLREKVKSWHTRWAGTRPRLELRMAEKLMIISDSRFGERAAEFKISPRYLLLLFMLDTPRTLDDVGLRAEFTPEEMEQGLMLLKQKRLVFEENGRFLNLVMIDEALAPHIEMARGAGQLVAQ
ncbi:MAG: RiPP maturation radical SAM C-methyltransferase [Terriglobales bacterium]